MLAFLFLITVLWAVPFSKLQAEEIFEIYTYEDLLQIAKEPAGSYKLMEDLDLEGLAWEPVDFGGSFDGNGHALLNLEVNGVGARVEETFDGNYKVYDTCFAGFFGTLKGARVSDLKLVNLKVRVETDQPCFIGGIAGYSENSTITGCEIQGRLELKAHEKMFGVGGIVGYGNGLIEQTSADVTLICTDTDAATRDEQFMGGAYAAGYLDLNSCQIVIEGYDSDHGYVHDGGLVGMYIFYPAGLDYKGCITDNSVSGQITFFEDNTNRRAYCNGFIGEIMNWNFTNSGNTNAFVRNEVFDYSVDLKPDLCEAAAYAETVIEPGCDTFGYTILQCEGCGYTYTDHYRLFQHKVTEWTVTKEPTVQDTGERSGVCALCGMVQKEELAKLEPPKATAIPESTAAPEFSGVSGADAVSERTAAREKGQNRGGEQEGDAAEKESKNVKEVFRNPVVMVVILVMVVLLVVGELLLYEDRKRSGGRG